MSEKTTGGPAFPLPLGNEQIDASVAGMTLRDYFAAQALQGILACGNETLSIATADGELVLRKLVGAPKLAYMYADIMLAERDK